MHRPVAPAEQMTERHIAAMVNAAGQLGPKVLLSNGLRVGPEDGVERVAPRTPASKRDPR